MRRLSVIHSFAVLIFAAACGQDGPPPQEEGSGGLSEIASRSLALSGDTDDDGIPDASDNCPSIANSNQANRDGTGPGDACELSLTWSYGVLSDYARYQSHKELVTFLGPILLTGRPDLMRVSSSSPRHAYLSPITQRLGVRSQREFLPGQVDTISEDEVLTIAIGEASVLGGAKASDVWLRVDGTATVAVSFFSGGQALGAASAAIHGTSLQRFAPPSGALFNRIELRATSGRFALKGPGQGVTFRLGNAQLPPRPGYEVVGGVYIDLDECAGLERVCDPLTTCTNLPGSYECGACPAGYTGTGASACTDIDECEVQPENCSPLVTCSNTLGGYQCAACPAGYRGDGSHCVDIDECDEQLDGCDPLVTCTNQPGSFECGACPAGYAGGGATGCVDIDECAGPARACDALTQCTNSPGGYTCGACPAGYVGSGATSCVDIDECADGSAGCSPLATCANTAGSFQCGACPSGYRGDGFECVDVDECAEQSAQCSELVSCENTIGSYVCGACPAGYSGDGHSCADIDECQTSPCDPLTACSNSAGGYQCGACPPGFAGNGHTGCVDIDECADGSDDCSPLATCGNTRGGFECGPCPSGYAGDGRSCSDVDECGLQTDQCDALVVCTNNEGSYACGPCPAGYSGDGRTCADIDECAHTPCHALTECSNTVGGYTCSACPSGYTGDGYAGCMDIDECAVDNGGCPETERCDNTPGSRVCVPCAAGSVGVTTQCGVGACAATGVTSCVRGVVHDSCAPGTPASSDATCNGVDDDCDGSRDEDYVAQATSCGIGACGRTGSLSCAGGQLIDSCAPGTPGTTQDAACDGIDDDCDGRADEDFIGGACTASGAQVCVGGQLVTRATCDDALFCNGSESCSAGHCVRTPRDLSDNNPCTDDACVEGSGITHSDRPLGSSCSDGNACNGAELCVACVESANLLINTSFERVWAANIRRDGVMPSDWWSTNPNNADTFSFDGSWGLAPSSFSSFTNVAAPADGQRWVAGYSGFLESFGQELRAPLVPGQRYRLSGKLHQSSAYPTPGGYNVSLSSDYVASSSRPNDVLLGRLATTASTTGWQDVSFEFTAPAAATDKLLLNFVSSGTAGSPAYMGLDMVSLVRTCAAGGALSCQADGAPVVIDDSNACTLDACVPATGASHTPVAAGTACNGSGACGAGGQCSNRLPVFTSTPPSNHLVSSGNFSYQATAADLDGDTLTFTRDTGATGTWTLSSGGLLSFPAPAAGMYVIAIQASDGRGGIARQRKLLQVTSGELSPPMVPSQPARQVVQAGTSFSYQVQVWTPTLDSVSYSFEVAPPPGMTLGAGGLVSWTPSASNVGPHTVMVRATSSAGSVLHTFKVSVVP